jgi:predicted  nucleic acid-binding Zn-ribbon protein
MNTRVLLIVSTILLLLTTATSTFLYIERNNLNKIVEDCEKGRDLVESEVVSFEKKIQKLEQELSDTSAELVSQKGKLNTIKKDLIIAQNRIDYLLKTGQIDKQRAEKLQKKIKQYEEKILAITPGVKTVEEAFSQIANANELEKALNLNKKYEEEINRLQQQISILTAEAATLQNRLSNVQARLEVQTQYKVLPVGKFWYKNGERGLIKDNRTNKVTGKKVFRIYFTVLPKQYEAPINGLTTKVLYETGGTQAVSYSYDDLFKEFYIQLDPKTKGRIIFYNGDTEIFNYVF